MKKRIRLCSCLLSLVLCFAFMLGGCTQSTKHIPYASSASPEKTCTLKVLATLTVKEFDGKPVDWKAGSFDNWVAVQIPEGSHTLVVDYLRNANYQEQYRNGIVIRYDRFMAGHTYEMVAAAGAESGGFSGLFTNTLGAMRDTVNRALRIGIRDVTNGQNGDFEWLEMGNISEGGYHKGPSTDPQRHIPTDPVQNHPVK